MNHAAPHRAAGVEGDIGEGVAWAEKGYDVVYVPRVGYTTGDIDVASNGGCKTPDSAIHRWLAKTVPRIRPHLMTPAR